MSRNVSDGVLEIDTKLGGWEHITSGYLITGDKPVLIEVGSQSSVDTVMSELAALGVGPDDLFGIALTHIHLDHAGGVGDIAAAFPKAKVFVHSRGARHLADPSRLVASAEMVYGEKLDSLYGRLSPTDAARIVVVEDGEKIEIGPSRSIEVIDSPGHAKHHLGFFDPQSGIVFTGDAAGVLLPEVRLLRPATPPADFDLSAAINSLDKFKDRKPVKLGFAHYGIFDNSDELLDEAKESLITWATVAESAFSEGRSIEDALYSQFGEADASVSAEAIERFDTLNGIHSNAAGLGLWLERGGRTTDLGHHH